ncbi:MAG: hypothetical protein IE919_15970 [Thioclava sp.]|nr:hypothetical protein [Thioclava sp.]MBD3804720.1 hypothetical protein [Thioclava sp.]
MSKSKPMTTSAVKRIQSAEAKSNGGQTAKGSFTTRAMAAAAANAAKSSPKK